MTVYIYERDAFRKMVAVEGKYYPHNQKNFGICSFKAFKKKWKKLAKINDFTDGKPPYAIDVEGNRAIYGLCGWNRYLVLNTGEIMFLKAAARIPEDIEVARKIGFRIFPEDLREELKN